MFAATAGKQNSHKMTLPTINTVFNTIFKRVKSHTGNSKYFRKKTDDNGQFPGVEQMQVNDTLSNTHLKAY